MTDNISRQLALDAINALIKPPQMGLPDVVTPYNNGLYNAHQIIAKLPAAPTIQGG